MKHHLPSLFLVFLLPCLCLSQGLQRLSLPNGEQLSAERVLHVMQDSEGFLWYATEGGGLCRDDGRQVLVFRSDADHPDLLGDNHIACLAEAGQQIVIGSFHGAYLLNKHDYSIGRLAEVDDKRVDDIVVASNGHWWLTANKKIYEYDGDGRLLKTYAAGNKYINRLHEDTRHRMWASQWSGGLLTLHDGRFVPAPWPLDAAPTDISDDGTGTALLIGTVGRGVVRYQPDNGTVEPTADSDSICMSRVSTDLQGRLLVADGLGSCYALGDTKPQAWFKGDILTRAAADSVCAAYHLSARPTALALSQEGDLWFSTGRDIRRMRQGSEEVVLGDTRDVSAMTFTQDGTLWLATIFGTLMTYSDGQLATDEYASNEFGDGVTQLAVDSLGRLLLVSDRYVRLYDPVRRTLRQQSREEDGVYSIELQETRPGCRWSQPEAEVVERMPLWVWGLLAALILILTALVAHIWQLHRQRERFLASMKSLTPAPSRKEKGVDSAAAESSGSHSDEPPLAGSNDPWLQQAIAQVEAHLSDDGYNIEQLATDLCMSRMTFYRKIRSVTGQKPTEFIRTIRLRRAAEMLREGRMTVTEVSYATGFASVSYFSRCFRAMFGVPPTHFTSQRPASYPHSPTGSVG
ncbi:MAG: helix-turn-helix domain-containing protein [Prevotella sp.]|nr:helix-turn-helix domain-containing protein [Prevotella sp.]